MKRTAVLLPAILVLLLAATTFGQQMGYVPAGYQPGYGMAPPQMALQGAPAGAAVQTPHYLGGYPGPIGLVGHTEAAGGSGSGGGNGSGCSDGCGGGCGGGCSSCGGKWFGPNGFFHRLFADGCCDPCISCGGIGCRLCGGGGHGPLGDGQCCHPRWYDIAVDVLYLKRENIGREIPFTGLGLLASDGIVLASHHLEFEYEPGFRITYQHVIGPGTNAEFTYFGTNNWATSYGTQPVYFDPTGFPIVADNNLYSILSEYGNINSPDGFIETDVADLHWIEYSTDLNSFEANVRRRWVSKGCHFHSSVAFGCRYVRLDEEFRHITIVDRLDPILLTPIEAQMVYNIETRNDLVGLQWAGDLWACVTPGLSVGGDIRAGIYGNRAQQRTSILTETNGQAGVPYEERDSTLQAAFVSDANLQFLYHFTSRCTFRGGYQFVYIDSVALANDNFNPVAPQVVFPQATGNRVITINHNGFAFYHGWTVGFECTW
jgi:hypothetical protein